MNEFEIVEYQSIEGLQIFFNTVDYRSAHFHAEWELLWLLDEPLSVFCQNRERVLNPGELMIFSPNTLHEFHKVDRDATFLCFQASPDILSKNMSLTLEDTCLSDHGTKEQLQRIRTLLEACIRAFLQQKSQRGLLCIGTINLALYEILQFMPHHSLTPHEISEMHHRNARLERLIQFVDENYMQKIRLSDFAEQEGYSLAHLSRFVKSTMNQTFQEYVNQVRFQCACRLICQGAGRMLDVCYEAGFSDYRYFSRTFQQKYHMTPEEFSRQADLEQLMLADSHHSLHSAERFYTMQESKELLKRYFPEKTGANYTRIDRLL